MQMKLYMNNHTHIRSHGLTLIEGVIYIALLAVLLTSLFSITSPLFSYTMSHTRDLDTVRERLFADHYITRVLHDVLAEGTTIQEPQLNIESHSFRATTQDGTVHSILKDGDNLVHIEVLHDGTKHTYLLARGVSGFTDIVFSRHAITPRTLHQSIAWSLTMTTNDAHGNKAYVYILNV
jgi:hypothetical protein